MVINFLNISVKDSGDDEVLVSITTCLSDLVYCAIIFHNPVYALIIRIDDNISNLYYNQLKELQSFQKIHIDS